MNNQWEKKTTRAFLSTQHNALCQGCIRFKLNLLLDCRIHDTVDALEMHKSKARNSRWKGFIIKSNAKQWNNDVLYELSGNRMTLCGLSAARTIQFTGWQTAKCTEQWFYLEGHVPWGHIYSFLQFLGLGRGSFTLQATLMQNIVEHLHQENRTVLKQTGESIEMCLILLITTSMIIYATHDYLHTAAQSCTMKAVTDSCR